MPQVIIELDPLPFFLHHIDVPNTNRRLPYANLRLPLQRLRLNVRCVSQSERSRRRHRLPVVQLNETHSPSFRTERCGQREINRGLFFDAIMRIAGRLLRRRSVRFELGTWTRTIIVLVSWPFRSGEYLPKIWSGTFRPRSWYNVVVNMRSDEIP